MSWERTHDEGDRAEWERADRYARLVAREMASGQWAVSLDRLEQAPEGEMYRHETAPSRRAALDLAEAWLARYDTA